MHNINKLYSSNDALSVDEMQRQINLHWFDLYLYYSVYYLAVEYLIKGNMQWEYPMIPVGKVQYLPALKLIMTPYGLEKQLIMFVTIIIVIEFILDMAIHWSKSHMELE